MQFIAHGIAFEFREPPGTAVGRGRAIFAVFMAVPEAAMNEDRGFIFGQNDVGADDAPA